MSLSFSPSDRTIADAPRNPDPADDDGEMYVMTVVTVGVVAALCVGVIAVLLVS